MSGPATVLLGCGGSSSTPNPVAYDASIARDASVETALEDSAIDAPEVASTEPPFIPIGLDAYRLWDRWPYLRIGARTYMRSTYDRSGGNEAADASHFLRSKAEDRAVTLDVVGNGVLDFVRTNHWHGSPWHYIVDGTDHVVTETSTSDPDHPVEGSTFEPAASFPPPLALTWSTTRGADLNWVPMPFTRSFELNYGRTHYGTGYYIYTLFAEGETNLSRPLRAWDETTVPSDDVVSLLKRAGEDIAPRGEGVRVVEGSIALAAGATVSVLDLAPGEPTTVRALRFTIPKASADAFAGSRIRITWDDRTTPSIDAPIALFFGTGTLYNRADAQFLVKAFPMHVRFDATTIELATYLPMPFFRRARIELIGGADAVDDVQWHVRTVPHRDPTNWVGYLHATFVDHGTPSLGHDLVLLDTQKTEGGGDWCGNFVGTSFIFTDTGVHTTLEGDPRFFFDDSQSPQAYGTGTEEWGGGGDYWGGVTMTLPFAGHPVGAPVETAKAPIDLVNSAYRFLLSDLMPFGRNARIQLEHGGIDDATEHYRTVTYWYGLPGACLSPSDTLHVGDLVDEAAHGYASPDASPPETMSSRWEWGVDRFPPGTGTIIQEESSDVGRHTTGTSELTLKIPAKNFGVLLRRKLDYAFPDQRADVLVADGSVPASEAKFEPAGTWYLAGSNRCAFMWAPGETEVIAPTIQTSNRRWREDEFLVPRRLTEGRSAIRVRLVFRKSDFPIAPGAPLVPQAWSELRYTAYAWTLPPVPYPP
jgi:hypothetical protein